MGELIVDARKSPEHYRGYDRVRLAIITNWEKVNKDDLDYLIKSILRPFCEQVILDTSLMRALS
jgi:hypothetical protein